MRSAPLLNHSNENQSLHFVKELLNKLRLYRFSREVVSDVSFDMDLCTYCYLSLRKVTDFYLLEDIVTQTLAIGYYSHFAFCQLITMNQVMKNNESNPFQKTSPIILQHLKSIFSSVCLHHSKSFVFSLSISFSKSFQFLKICSSKCLKLYHLVKMMEMLQFH
jgi:hypothetical protein